MDRLPEAAQRIDTWLCNARFFKSRSIAGKLCRAGRLRVDGRVIAKPSALVRPGMVLTFPKEGRIRIVRIQGVAARRGPASLAETLYEDLSPPMERTERFAPAPDGARPKGAGAPTKKERRQIARFKGL